MIHHTVVDQRSREVRVISKGSRFLGIATILGALTFAAPSIAGGLDELPKEIQDDLYNKDAIDPIQPLGESAYRDWKAKSPPPWTIGYASSYAGNTWRASIMKRLQEEIIPKWQKLGLIKEVKITQSNLNDSVQIQQMRQLVDEGVDAIIVCCSNPTALNQTVEYAYQKGVPVFSGSGYLTSPYAVNSSTNLVVAGMMMGEWMAREVGGKGKVLLVEGIPGAPASDTQTAGIRKALLKHPGVSVVGQIAGMWSDQVAEAEIRRWLSTYAGELDGIIVQSGSELGAVRALKLSGRPMVPITVGGELGALCTWRKNPSWLSGAIQSWPPGDDFELSWNIMMRTLQGQGPKVRSILARPQMLDFATLEKALAKDCDEDSADWYNAGAATWASKAYLDNFFLRPADPEAFRP
jgi:ribose transport system substrate-binding protein